MYFRVRALCENVKNIAEGIGNWRTFFLLFYLLLFRFVLCGATLFVLLLPPTKCVLIVSVCENK